MQKSEGDRYLCPLKALGGVTWYGALWLRPVSGTDHCGVVWGETGWGAALLSRSIRGMGEGCT